MDDHVAPAPGVAGAPASAPARVDPRSDLAGDGRVDDDGVDVTLIRWMLGLTPEQRLDVLQGFVDSVAALRDATRA